MKINRKKHPTFFLAAILLLAVVLVITWVLLKDNTQNTIRDGVNYGPPTASDKETNDHIKNQLPSENGDRDSSEASAGRAVSPTISAWGQPEGPGHDLKINGYIPGLHEEPGTCTITLTREGMTASSSKSALQNVNDMSCGQLTIPYTQLSAGVWSAVLDYESPTSSGKSTRVNIEVN